MCGIFLNSTQASKYSVVGKNMTLPIHLLHIDIELYITR